jgi:sensor c-di-GMP phosphodiesterase-like protein
VTDVGAADGLWVGVINLSHRAPMVVRGGYRPGWIARVPAVGRDANFTDGERSVAMYRPPTLDYVAYVAAPRAAQQQHARALAWTLGPLGALAGVLLWLGLRRQVRQLRSLPAVMRAALAADEFFVEYQPIVELATGRWIGAEVLVRWRRPDGSLIGPDVSIPVAERSGLICRITRCVIGIVASEARPLLARHPDFMLSINLSSADLATGDTLHLLRELVNRPGFAARNIAIEATERGLLEAKATLPLLKDIRALGIRAAIDDFGTGYSGLSYLGAFEIDTLKIDKLFIDTIGTDAATSNVAVHIIQMASTLQLDIVAEGIEHAAQAGFLREHGVKYGQAWLYARAMPMPQLLATLDASGARMPHAPAGSA